MQVQKVGQLGEISLCVGKEIKIWWPHSETILLSVLVSVIAVLSPTSVKVVYF